MIKNFTQINQAKIAYLDNQVVSEKTLVFIHGNSLNSNSFLHQFKDVSLCKYRLIALDLPGHGDSDFLENYSILYSINVIVEFCKNLKLNNFILIGHSLGGHFAIQSLPKLEKCIGIFIFGTPPLNKPMELDRAFLPNVTMPLLFKNELNNSEIKILSTAMCSKNLNFDLENCIDNTDGNFREQLANSIAKNEMSNEVEILKYLKIPIAICNGKYDQFVNSNYIRNLTIPTLWQNKVLTIKNSGHCPQLENPYEFNAILNSFVKNSYK